MINYQTISTFYVYHAQRSGVVYNAHLLSNLIMEHMKLFDIYLLVIIFVKSSVLDTIYVVCFSLILLSVDLTSPHIKNKMSKREFIKNTRRAADDVNEDFAGHLYDNVYLVGHVAPNKK